MTDRLTQLADLAYRRRRPHGRRLALAATALPRSASKRTFARHFAEMLVVMLLGMGVLEALAALAFTAAGSSLTGQPGAFRVMLMGFSMTAPMVLWMSYRGHSARRNAEMAASMLVPSALAASPVAAGAFGVGAAFAVQHAVMVPAMLAVMLWRYDDYARPHAASSPAGSAPGHPEPPDRPMATDQGRTQRRPRHGAW